MSNSFTSQFIIRGRKSYRTQDMSNNSDNEPSDNNEDNYREENSPGVTQQNSQLSTRGSQPSSQKSPTKVPNNNSEWDIFSKTNIGVLLFVLLSVYVYVNDKMNEKKFASIDGLKQIFPTLPDETFDDFETIIDEIVFYKAVHPAVFLFLYEANEHSVNKLVDHLANYASQKLETNQNYINVHPNEFNSEVALNDYGYLINKYSNELVEKKVMVVKNLQHIPGQTAQAFHSFCDEISPLVEKVVYIFTLKVDFMTGKAEKIAESNLKRAWKDLKIDTLMPLITRVTSTVLKV